MNKKGFTLVEVILTIAIMALLLIILIPNIFSLISKNKESSCNSLRDNIISAAKMYVTENKYNLEFTCPEEEEKVITLETLIDNGYLELDNTNTIKNPATDEVLYSSDIKGIVTVSVIYNCTNKEFSYNVEGISCVDSNCEAEAQTPTINKINEYTGNEITGVFGGANVTITGDAKATNEGTYTAYAKPTGDFCWIDTKTKETRTYTWRIVDKYTITLDNDGATTPGTSVLYGKYNKGIYLDNTYTKEITTSQNSITLPEKTGHSFSGYYTENNKSGKQLINISGYLTDDFKINLYTSNVTLYAGWTPNTHTVKYYNDKELLKTDEATYGSEYTISTDTPTKNGYKFVKWNTESNGNGKDYSPENKIIIKENISLYAMWTPNTYTINYDANGGSGAPTAQTKTYGEDLTLSNTEPSRNGYTFLGWSTNKNETKEEYKKGSNFTTENNTTLYAVWKANTYIGTFDANGGTNGNYENSKEFNFGEKYNIDSYIPTKDGYKFDGWYSAKSGGTKFSENWIWTATSNYTFYAHWTPITYTVKYSCGTGTGTPPTSHTVSYTEAISLKSNTCTKEGHSFKAWKYGNNEYNVGSGPSKLTEKDGDTITFTAQWTPNTYTISYNANGGSGAPASQTKTYGVDLTLSNTEPKRDNYKFIGWSTSSTATSATYSAGGTYKSNASTTLYAVWKSTYSNTWVDGKSDCFPVNPNTVEPNSFWTVKLNVCWKETYNAYTNKSKVSITGMDASLSDYYGYLFYLGGGQGDSTKGIYVNGSLLTTMSYHTGGYSVSFGSVNTYYPVAGTFPMTSGEISHNSDGTLTVPVRVYLTAARAGYTTGYYSSFDSTVNITLTDTRP